MYFARGSLGELQIDISLTKNPLFAVVEKEYTTTKQFWIVRFAVQLWKD